MNTDALGVLLASGDVLRFHTMPCLRRQTTGQHMWRTLVILHWLFYPNYPPPHVSCSMMLHDVPEIHTGDTPGDVKADHEGLSNALTELEKAFFESMGIVDMPLTPLENKIIKVCDRADLLFHALDEYEMGNLHMEQIVRRAYQMFSDLVDDNLSAHWPRVANLAAALNHRYMEALYD